MPKPTVARLTTPAQLVASLPLWIGYLPAESLVVACCHEPRGRVGLTMRFDLPHPGDERLLVAEVVRRVRKQRASRLLLAVYTEEPGAGVRADLVAGIVGALGDELLVTDAVLVRAGRFWSYVCHDPRCCPLEGTPVDAAGSDAPVQLLAAEQVLRGQAVLPDREALELSLAGPTSLAMTQARQRCASALEEMAQASSELGVAALRETHRAAWDQEVQRLATPPATVDPALAARLAVSLTDRLLRDTLAAQYEPEAIRPLLIALCRATPAPYDAPVCTLYAWLAYCDGGGAEVTIALERALASDPGYPLAHLLAEVLDQQVPPSRLRRLTREAVRESPAASRRGRRSRPSRG